MFDIKRQPELYLVDVGYQSSNVKLQPYFGAVLIIDSIPMTGSKYWEELILREVISYDDAKVIRVGYR